MLETLPNTMNDHDVIWAKIELWKALAGQVGINAGTKYTPEQAAAQANAVFTKLKE